VKIAKDSAASIRPDEWRYQASGKGLDPNAEGYTLTS